MLASLKVLEDIMHIVTKTISPQHSTHNKCVKSLQAKGIRENEDFPVNIPIPKGSLQQPPPHEIDLSDKSLLTHSTVVALKTYCNCSLDCI
ncbi:hypothetical protein CEXT_115611 [Caerostris extrusa]|uniref:Uncharacterized protein n=1 Tax=Caerostris extrusa TaxID=172846 RepID=A0AAV4RZW6_CAEEX|nr:hypothetical protein CEXT_115611 [Caerostris extrusa]